MFSVEYYITAHIVGLVWWKLLESPLKILQQSRIQSSSSLHIAFYIFLSNHFSNVMIVQIMLV